MKTPECPYCQKFSKPVTGKIIYPHRSDLFNKKFFYCDPCKAWVGCHRDGRPLGRLANAELRRFKQRAHAAFDPIWRSGILNRGQAYSWLAKKFGRDEVHIGEMSVDECKQVIKFSSEIKYS